MREASHVWSKFVLTHRLYETRLSKGFRVEPAIFQSLYGSPESTSDIFPFHLHFIFGLDTPLRFFRQMRYAKVAGMLIFFFLIYRDCGVYHFTFNFSRLFFGNGFCIFSPWFMIISGKWTGWNWGTFKISISLSLWYYFDTNV